jgi:mannose-6-phosphate isomerase
VETAASKAKNSEPLRAALKDVFSGLMHASDDTIARELTKLVGRLAAADPVRHSIHISPFFLTWVSEPGSDHRHRTCMQSTLSPVDKLCLRVEKDYPNDVGCFCVYLLNYVTLAPGESMFMAANEPHAYLSGGVRIVVHISVCP